MKPFLLLCFSLFIHSVALASEDLAKKSGCIACHALNKKLLGPSFQQISARYRGQEDAVDSLLKKIKEGGSGAWGTVPMPAQSQLKDADAKALAIWLAELAAP